MKCRRLFFILAPLVMALLLILAGNPASAQLTTYGTLDNFDVINDTGKECHGFEIELEGISSADVVYTFGAPYQRYGDPTVATTATGVIIRYQAVYDKVTSSWVSTVPGAPGATPYTPGSSLPTQGHSCWTGGVATPADYYNSGCDHFGASLNATPTKTTYRWLVESTTTPGTLTAFGSNVPLPAPVWNVTPPPVPQDQPVVAAVIAPPAPADPSKCGEALWAKVYVTELPSGLQADDLDFMVIDHPDVNIVPNEPAEVEFEWVLLQACPGNAGEQEFGGGAEVGAGNEAVSRRFEFYKYTGQYDPEPEAINEALCDNPTEAKQQIPERCGDPIDGVAGVGELIGAQNVAINLAAPVVTYTIGTSASPVAGGSTSGGGTVNSGDSVTVQASANAGYNFVNWTEGGKDVSSSASYTFTASANRTLEANFVLVTPANDPPVCELAQPTLAMLWPANHRLVSVGIVNVSDPNTDQVTIRITGVTQDEPVNGLGDGDTSPDAVLQGDTVLLRSERSGNGNGRVYRVNFTADDGRGGVCSGSVHVTVPKSMQPGSTAIDDGQRYDSMRQ